MKRPFSVTIIGMLILAQGLIFAIFAGFTLSIIGAAFFQLLPPGFIMELPDYTQRELLFTGAALVMGICCLVSGIGVLRLRSWAWLMAMIVQGINLATELLNYLQNQAFFLNMLVSVVIVLYLNQRDIQRSFSAAQHRSDPISTRTIEADHAAAAEAQREAASGR